MKADEQPSPHGRRRKDEGATVPRRGQLAGGSIVHECVPGNGCGMRLAVLDLGSLIGSDAGRIARARFSVDGTQCQPTASEAPNTLHGGVQGRGERSWNVTPVPAARNGDLALEHTFASPMAAMASLACGRARSSPSRHSSPELPGRA